MNCFLKLIIGFLIVALDLSVMAAGMKIDIISDIIGYAFIIQGTTQMIEWSPCFKKSRKFAIFSLITYCSQRLIEKIGVEFTIRGLFLGLTTMFFIYMTYYIMEGLYVKNKTEKTYEINQTLRGTWIAMAVAEFLKCFLALSDLPAVMEELGYPGLDSTILLGLELVAFLIQVFFMLTLNQNRVLLEAKGKEEKC